MRVYYVDYYKECYPFPDDCGFVKAKSLCEANALCRAYKEMGYKSWVRIEYEED